MEVRYDKDKKHAWIDGKQYVSLERFIEAKSEMIQEMRILNEEVDRLRAENGAYKVLLKDVLNKE